MKQELQSLSQLTKIRDQKGFLIKVALVSFVALVALVALFFELQFRKPIILEGTIRSCSYSDYKATCNYLETQNGSFLLTQGIIDKVRQERPTFVLEGKKLRAKGFISRQKLKVESLGEIHRFQIEKLEFLE